MMSWSESKRTPQTAREQAVWNDVMEVLRDGFPTASQEDLDEAARVCMESLHPVANAKGGVRLARHAAAGEAWAGQGQEEARG